MQITTRRACHLDAADPRRAARLPLARLDIFFIENVGNLICPASFDLGQHRNVVLLSVTEGDDKPAKYPVMFRAADLVLLTKMDLAPVLDDFDLQRAESAVRDLANAAPVIPLSARKPLNLEPWEGGCVVRWRKFVRQTIATALMRRIMSTITPRQWLDHIARSNCRAASKS